MENYLILQAACWRGLLTKFGFSVLAMTALMTGLTENDDVPELPKDTLPQMIVVSKTPVGFETPPPFPANNPMTPEKVALGRRLFFDPILSKDGTVSCASCHRPDHGFAGRETISVGINGRKGTRNAPTILNRAFGTRFSWDGRDDTLEQQILGPLTSEAELGGDIKTVIANLKKDKSYPEQFQDVFGGRQDKSDLITVENIAKAIATFERTLTSSNSAVDKFRNRDYEALSKEARQGLWLFESRGGCWKCHNGPNLADEEFHNTGVGFGQLNRDLGRMKVTKNEEHRFQFKTPTLRDIEFTAPYMHDGSVKTLREVVEFYNKGGAPRDPGLDEDMKPLNLTDQEVGFIVEFLKALSGEPIK
ncbi:MAG: cytochrome c peroxidase [Planctomycetota bacterium]